MNIDDKEGFCWSHCRSGKIEVVEFRKRIMHSLSFAQFDLGVLHLIMNYKSKWVLLIRSWDDTE